MNRQLAAELNNLGVAYLDSGDLRKALELFREALKYTMGEIRPCEAMEPVPMPPGPSPAAPSDMDCGRGVSKRYEDEDSMGPSSQPPASKPFVHIQALNLVASPTAYSSDVLINATIVSSIVIFNLGIVYHLKGLEGGNVANMRLLKAMSLYQKSHILLSDAGVPRFSTGNPVVDMLSMALFNNMAQACFEMSLYTESRQYFDDLIYFAQTVVPMRYGDAYISSLLDQQKSNYLLNAIILQAPKLAPAA